MQNLDIIIQLLAYEGQASNTPADSSQIKNRIQDSEITSFLRFQPVITDGTVDQNIDCVLSADTDYLAIFTDQTVTIKLNGGTESITLVPRAAGIKTFAYFNKGSISALSISNASGNDAQLDIIMADK